MMHTVIIGEKGWDVVSSEFEDTKKLMALVLLAGSPCRPGEIIKINGHPFCVTGEITRQEYESRVVESGVSAEWLQAPVSAVFYALSTD